MNSQNKCTLLLLGYCIAANAHYGLLANINADGSDDLIKIIETQPAITHIIRLLPYEKGRGALMFPKAAYI